MSTRGKRKRRVKAKAPMWSLPPGASLTPLPGQTPVPGFEKLSGRLLTPKDTQPGSELFRLNSEHWMRTSEADAADPTDPDAHEELVRRRQDIIDAYERELTKHRSGKPRGALKKSTIYVHALARHSEHANLSAKMLWRLADPKKLDGMKEATFRDHVTNARRRK